MTIHRPPSDPPATDSLSRWLCHNGPMNLHPDGHDDSLLPNLRGAESGARAMTAGTGRGRWRTLDVGTTKAYPAVRGAAGGVRRAWGGGGARAVGAAGRQAHPGVRGHLRVAGRACGDERADGAVAGGVAHRGRRSWAGWSPTAATPTTCSHGSARIGIDEIAYRKGHRYLVTIVLPVLTSPSRLTNLTVPVT